MIFKILNLLLSVSFIVCYFYLSFSFILLEFNVLNWDMPARLVVWALISGASLFRLMDLFWDKKIKENDDTHNRVRGFGF